MTRAVLALFPFLLIAAAGSFAQSTSAPNPGGQALLITSVQPKSAAAQAGIVKGDVLLALNGFQVATVDDVEQILAAQNPGTTISATILHSGNRRELLVTLANPSDQPPLGLTFAPETPGSAPSGSRGAALVELVAPNSPAAQVGLKPGDVILSVDDTAISRRNSLATLINAHKPGDVVTLSVVTAPTRAGQNPVAIKVALANTDGRPFLGVQSTTLTQYRPLTPGQTGQGYDRFYPFSSPLGSGSLPSGPGSGLSVPQGGLSF